MYSRLWWREKKKRHWPKREMNTKSDPSNRFFHGFRFKAFPPVLTLEIIGSSHTILNETISKGTKKVGLEPSNIAANSIISNVPLGNSNLKKNIHGFSRRRKQEQITPRFFPLTARSLFLMVSQLRQLSQLGKLQC